MNQETFDIPVVLFIFKRDKASEIVKRIAEVKPQKLYIMADEGRTDEEKILAHKCRELVESNITWECEVIKNYADSNRGVYRNIAEGAKWVLRREKWAIFLEDDNLPETTFFQFCSEMLSRYENDTRILWICGTNYLEDYKPANNVSYVFTRHMLPCGWASWASKFERFYDGNLDLCEDTAVMERIGDQYCNKKVFKQYKKDWMKEYKRLRSGKRTFSWDYQMDFSIKAHNLYGICPCKNQIKNIGADEFSTHGGKSLSNVMTRRFCGMNSLPLEFPLVHPKTVLPDPVFEKKIGEVILYPLQYRVKYMASDIIRKILRVPEEVSMKKYLISRLKR